MMDATDRTEITMDHHKRLLRRFAVGLALFTALISIASLAGWGLGIDMLTRLSSTFPAMVPPTAACLLLGAVGALCIAGDLNRAFAMTCGLLVVAIVLREYVIATPVDVAAQGDAMSPATRIGCLILATSLLLQGLHQALLYWPNVLADTLGIALTAIPVTGYILTGHQLGDTLFYAAMAPLTAAGLMSLFLALLMLRVEGSWLSVLLAPEPGSRMARRIFPAKIAITLLACAVAYRLESVVEFDTALFVCLLAFVLIVASLATNVFFAGQVNRLEQRIAAAEREVLETQRARMQEELDLLRVQRMEGLGQLVVGVAHDFNNLLEVISGNLDLVVMEPNPERIGEHVAHAHEGVRQATMLTTQLLAYGGKSRLETTRLEIDPIVEQSLALFRRACPPQIEIRTDLRAGQALVDIDPAILQQALLNLMLNARDAMPDGGRLTVQTAVERLSIDDLDDHPKVDRATFVDGLFATVTITDSGTGMSPETLARATEPFFTTKEVGSGTGLGLSMVEGFCRQSGGSLSITSRPGGGCTVTCWFPQRGEGRVTPEAPPPRRPPLRIDGKGTVMIVDDESQIARTLARRLEILGYSTIVASDGEDALSLLATGTKPDLVISDVVMPGRVQGDMLAKGIGELYPDLPIIMMSGRASGSRRPLTAGGEPVTILPKPIDMSELRAAILRAMPRREDVDDS
ncbi:ATP-binding protein [Sulfitobacter sp. LCG007]